MEKSSRLFFFVVLASVYCLAWLLQERLLLNHDVSWLSIASGRLLQGGSYTDSFLETNPPLILYLYLPLVFLNHSFQLALPIALRCYIFFIGSLSLLLCAAILKQSLAKNDRFNFYLLMLLISVTFFILPISEFGQRENVTLMLVLPYFLLVAARLQNGLRSEKVALPLVVGLLAGLGFSIKPYFFIPLAMVEVYYLLQKKQAAACLRTETLAILVVVLLYVSLILRFNPDYLTTILPLIVKSYYQNFARPLAWLLRDPLSFFTCITLGFYGLCYRANPYRQLSSVLLLGALGFWLVFLIQRTGWYYQSLPGMAFDLLLCTLLFSSCVRRESTRSREPFLDLLLLAALAAGLYSSPTRLKQLIMLYPTFFVCALIGLLTFHGCASSSGKKSASGSWHALYSIVLGVLIFLCPLAKIVDTYDSSRYYHSLYQNLLRDMAVYRNEKVAYLTLASEMVFPNISYTQQNYQSRFWSLAWLPLMKEPEDHGAYADYRRRHQKEMDFYISAFLEDLHKNQPRYIFVDTRQRGHYFFTVPPDYPRLFSLNAEFKHSWSKYRYVKTLDQRPLYRLDVYELRKNLSQAS